MEFFYVKDGNKILQRFSASEDANGILTPAHIAILSDDQDPILDHTNSVVVSVNSTSNSVIFTPPAGCKFVSMLSDNDVFIRTDANLASSSANGSYKILGLTRENVPVTANVGIFAVTANSVTTSLRITPYKARP